MGHFSAEIIAPPGSTLSGNQQIGFFPAPAVAKWPMERQCARVLTLWPKLVSISETVASGFYEISATGDRLRAM